MAHHPINVWQMIRYLIAVLCWVCMIICAFKSYSLSETIFEEVNAKLPEKDRFTFFTRQLHFRRMLEMHERFYPASNMGKQLLQLVSIIFACFITAVILALVWNKILAAFVIY